MFDELSYAHLLVNYFVGDDNYKNHIREFLNTSFYICFFCELFENDNLQTIGNKVCDLEFSKLFFSNAKDIFLCNTRNINYLLKHNIYDNITYFPPIGYSQLSIDKHHITSNDNQIYDVLLILHA